jgi:hypothetical protein
MFGQNCQDLYPFKQGVSFTTQHFNGKNKLTSTVKQKMLSVQNNGSQYTAELDNEVLDAKNKSINKFKSKVMCDGTTLTIDTRAFSGQGMNDMPPNTNMEVKFSGDNFDFPLNATQGQTLKDISFGSEAYMNGMKIMSFNMKITNRKVEGIEKITVTAGTFEAYKISYDSEVKTMGMTKKFKAVSWIAKGVGMVKSENYDDKGTLHSYSQLTEFVQ